MKLSRVALPGKKQNRGLYITQAAITATQTIHKYHMNPNFCAHFITRSPCLQLCFKLFSIAYKVSLKTSSVDSKNNILQDLTNYGLLEGNKEVKKVLYDCFC